MTSRKARAVVLATVVGVAAVLTGCDAPAAKPTADTFVDATAPNTVYGKTNQISVDASPQREAFLQFDLTKQKGTVLEARLRLHVADTSTAGSPNGGTVARVLTPTWSESSLKYSNRPTDWRPIAGEIGKVTRNTWVEVEVTRAVSVGKVITLGIRTTSTDGADYDSRESGANAPQLIVTTGDAPKAVTGTKIAAAGDLVCSPDIIKTDTACHQMEVSGAILADSSVSKFLALGDLQYQLGELANFNTMYEPSYGRIKAKTKPAVGNHEYGTEGAAGYFTYFGSAAGDPTKGYYSYDIGSAWHIVALNSNCTKVSCVAGSAQEKWLRADLAASTRPCTIAYWHHPRFTSGDSHPNDPNLTPFWRALEADGAEIVLSGHVHTYERFAPQKTNTTADANGIREFVVGTGGRDYDGFSTAQPNSRVRLRAFGYLELTLGNDSRYSWRFLDEFGAVRDSGVGTCH